MAVHATGKSRTALAPATSSATILVVEDDEPIRLAVRELLESEGYEVVVACDGEEALGAIASGIPSLIITDLQMPRLDGIQLCERLRTDPETELVPIVVLTAAHRVEGVTSRVDAILRKPFDVDALLATVAQFIRPTLPPRLVGSPPSVRMTLGPVLPTFVLYVTSGSVASQRAESTVRKVASDRQASLEVIDVGRDPPRARADGVAMTPMLMRTQGRQRDVYLGDLSDPMLIEEFVGGG
ncbi:MAG: response regulator [Polyangiales bacterium]